MPKRETKPPESETPHVDPRPQGPVGETEAAETKTPYAPRARQSAAPMCPYHQKTRCVSKRSDPYFTRYYCPEEGCTFLAKIPRPNLPTRLHAEEQQGDHSAR